MLVGISIQTVSMSLMVTDLLKYMKARVSLLSYGELLSLTKVKKITSSWVLS